MSHRNGNGIPDSNSVDAPQTQKEAAEELSAPLPLTLGYKPSFAGMLLATEGDGRFPSGQMLCDVERMVVHPDCKLPYGYYKAGISSVKFKVKAGTTAQAEFVHKFFTRLWHRSVKQLQLCYDYGWSAHEIIYEMEQGLLCFTGLRDLHPLDSWALTKMGQYQGFSVRGVLWQSSNRIGRKGDVRLWGPGRWPAKGLWLTHDNRWHRWYGRSQLIGAWRPWRRLAGRDGAEDVIDGGIYRFAYCGPVVRFPSQDFRKKGTSGDLDFDAARNESRQFAEQAKAGVSSAWPSDRDQHGNYKWDLEWPKTVLDVSPLLEYEGNLQRQISRGVGVPPELFEASETGSGWSGRKIPLLGFYTQQVDEARALVWQAKQQIADPLLRWNFGPHAWCDVEVEIDMPEALAGGEKGAGGAPGAGAAPPPEQKEAAAADPLAGLAGKGGGRKENGAEFSTAVAEPEPATVRVPTRATSFTLSAAMDGEDPAAFPSPDVVVDEILSAVRRLSREARQSLFAELSRYPIDRAMPIVRRWVERWHGELADLLTEARLAATLQGMRAIAARIEPVEREAKVAEAVAAAGAVAAVGQIPPLSAVPPQAPPPLPMIAAAVQSLQAKRAMIPSDFGTLTNAAKQQAFTVAGAETEAVVGKVRDALAKAVETGGTLKTFKADLEQQFEEGSFLAPAHAETIFRVNVLGAYSDGQERLLDDPAVGGLFPYREYNCTHDDRVRPEHKALETLGIQGTNLYRADDPVWSLFRPPWAWNDRCVWRPVSIREAARKGIAEAIAWLETGLPPVRPDWVAMPPFRPDLKFDRQTEGVQLGTDAAGRGDADEDRDEFSDDVLRLVDESFRGCA